MISGNQRSTRAVRRSMGRLGSVLMVALGTALVVGSGYGVYLVLENAPRVPSVATRDVVIVGQEVGERQPIPPRAVRLAQAPGDLIPATAVANLGEVEGKLATAKLVPGEILLKHQLIVTSEDSTAMIQKAMLAGAQGYVTKPISPQVVLETIRNVRGRHQNRMSRIMGSPPMEAPQVRPRGMESYGRRIVVFGAKGGVGKTTIAANLSVALKVRTGREVALVDADFYFGDVSLHLNVASKTTILDLLPRVADMDGGLLSQVMAVHPTGLRVLTPPPRPEQAELIKVDHLKRLLTALPRFYDYIVVDCHQYYDDRMLAVLDHSDLILLVLTPEIGPIRNSKHFLRLADTMGYGRDRVVLLLNRADSNVGIGLSDIRAGPGGGTHPVDPERRPSRGDQRE